MNITQLDTKMIGIKHTAPFALYPQIIPGKVQQTIQRMQELGLDKNERYIIYEPMKNEQHQDGLFYTGVVMEGSAKELPADMEIIHLSGSYAVLETIFEPSRMGEYYTRIDQWIDQSDHQHAQDRFIVELYKEVANGTQQLLIYMPVQPRVRE